MHLPLPVTLGLAAALIWSPAQAREMPLLASGPAVSDSKLEQGGSEADELTEMLERITLPDGFEIEVFALAPGARHLAVAPSGKTLFIGTMQGRVWAVSLDRRGSKAEAVAVFAPFVDFTMPHGVCFAPDGTLYIAEQNRVLEFPQAEAVFSEDEMQARVVVPKGELIPPAEESQIHTSRICEIGPDGRLYISLGQPYNVSPANKLAFYEETGIGGILAMQRDGSEREVYTVGIRNSVGMEFHPSSGDLWWTDNQVDGMGDDTPPEEINRQTAAGQDFGFPWYGGGSVRTEPYLNSEPPADLIFPVVETDAHAASLGMTFYGGEQFPEHFKDGIFVAQHGSWNRTKPIGARVIFVPLGPDQQPGPVEIFAEGWLDEDSGSYLGRPADVAHLPDGSLLVTDDRAGAVYRIFYKG